MAHIGLSALVTISLTNSSVGTSATVSSSALVTPATTNRRSNRRGAEPVPELPDLALFIHIEVLDLHPSTGGFLPVVERRAVRAADGGHHAGATLDVLLGDGQAQAARGPDQQDFFIHTGS